MPSKATLTTAAVVSTAAGIAVIIVAGIAMVNVCFNDALVDVMDNIPMYFFCAFMLIIQKNSVKGALRKADYSSFGQNFSCRAYLCFVDFFTSLIFTGIVGYVTYTLFMEQSSSLVMFGFFTMMGLMLTLISIGRIPQGMRYLKAKNTLDRHYPQGVPQNNVPRGNMGVGVDSHQYTQSNTRKQSFTQSQNATPEPMSGNYYRDDTNYAREVYQSSRSKQKFCSECGMRVEESSANCPMCGKRLK